MNVPPGASLKSCQAGEFRLLAQSPLSIDIAEVPAAVAGEKGRPGGVVGGEDIEVAIAVGVGDTRIE